MAGGTTKTKVEKQDMEGRNVTMLPAQWAVVDAFAEDNEMVTVRGPNTSQALRQILNEWRKMKRREHNTIAQLADLLKEGRPAPTFSDAPADADLDEG